MRRRLGDHCHCRAAVRAPSPAGAERLVVSMSNHRVAVTSSFIGEDLVLFGTIEPDAGGSAARAIMTSSSR